MTDHPIQSAATLVLARAKREGIEVFLSRRTSKASFMANAYVYPGGRVDDSDHGSALAERLRPFDPAWFAGQFDGSVAPTEARAHYVAALRESFEEAGVLYARHSDGSPLELTDDLVAARFAGHRTALNRGELSFLELLEVEDLILDAAGLDYFAHWITPSFENRRFDTRFFFGVLPVGQEPVPDYEELVHGDWFAPSAALRAYQAGEIELVPPTLCTLADLAGAGGLEGVRAWAAAERPVPIEPKVVLLDGNMAFLLPGDARYPSDRPVEGPTRVVLRDGRFVRE